MNCQEIQKNLSAYLEGMASPEDQELIEQHLASCQTCSTVLYELNRTGEVVKNLKEVEPPPWLTQKIMSRVRTEEEKKRGILQKLFYPLHIKVPLEALATVFIAVIAVYVFRAVEPEMKHAQLSAPSATVITREEAPKPSQVPAPESPALQSKKPPLLPPTSRVGEATRKEKKPYPSSPAAEPASAKKQEAMADKSEEGLKEAERTALSAAARDARERKKLAAAPMPKEAAVKKARPIGVTVKVKDMNVALGEIQNYLGQLGARRIEKESREGKEVLTAELSGQKVEEFLEKLKATGEIKEKAVPMDMPEENIPIRVEIVATP